MVKRKPIIREDHVCTNHQQLILLKLLAQKQDNNALDKMLLSEMGYPSRLYPDNLIIYVSHCNSELYLSNPEMFRIARIIHQLILIHLLLCQLLGQVSHHSMKTTHNLTRQEKQKKSPVDHHSPNFVILMKVRIERVLFRQFSLTG